MEIDPTGDEIDIDGDGQTDGLAYDDNADGTPDYIEVDTDGDGAIDTIVLDVDFDGEADVIVVDLDGDGALDQAYDAVTGEELVIDDASTETETETDPFDPTSSETGKPDPVEGSEEIEIDTTADEVDTDGNGVVDTYEFDDNGDGVADYVEVDVDEDGEIDAALVDSDFDGVFDVAISDTDGDGDLEAYDIETGEPIDTGGETGSEAQVPTDDVVVSQFPEDSPFQL
jgi:hypothetical protein